MSTVTDPAGRVTTYTYDAAGEHLLSVTTPQGTAGYTYVTGQGAAYTKTDLLKQAHDKSSTYEHQESSDQIVRVYGNTAVVTAKLWIKGTSGADAFDFHVWYSDTYVRTASGWRYAFGQAGCHLP